LKSLEERFRANQQRFISIGTKGEQLFSQAPKPRFRPVHYNSAAALALFDLRTTGSQSAQPDSHRGRSRAPLNWSLPFATPRRLV